ncbi:Enhancer of polycomb-like transcription factor protein, putative isoform 1 [Hibiscus syriacus]|uniref:Enhancer of polycomb-like transcription factor protein, putative isoform 1 n=1 Tax=Hibiscus syriacus TaxID=106335 RepID=A0A6A3AAJ9_HIBSY|nr:Enhancer of polycomb-like transcription factor protein, putative isoform 1 [Hibiscus syriacus]
MRDKKKLKDDERIEETIRSLLKLPGNKRCINCNLLGPQYVCTTFSTFVCTTCSGLHREFTHRVKSVSMAKFTEEEASALQAGGNERARQIYFKTWDPQRNSLPNSSDLPMLRNFIKHVYVDKKFTGETLPSPGLRYRAQSPEKKKVIVFTRSKTTLHEGRHEYGGSSPAGKSGAVRVIYTEPRSPRLPQENSIYEFSPRNHRQIEIIDNRRRYDSPGNAIQKITPAFHGANMDAPPAQNQKNSSSSSGMESLIDFSMDALPSNAEAAPNLLPAQPSSDVGNRTDELSSKGKATPESSANPLDLFLFDLQLPLCISPAIPEGQILALTSKKGSSPVPPAINAPKIQSPYGHVFPGMQKHAEQSPRTVEALNNQPGMSLPMHNAQQSSNLSTEQISGVTSKSAEETSSKDRVKPLSAETKSSGRRELPQDLFTESYGSSPGAGAGFDLMFYHNAMPAAAFTSTAKPNSFDLNSDATPAQAPPSPSLASVVGGLLPRTPSIDAHSSGIASHSSNIASNMTAESPFTLAMPSGVYMGNQLNRGLPPSSPQGIGGSGSGKFNSVS